MSNCEFSSRVLRISSGIIKQIPRAVNLWNISVKVYSSEITAVQFYLYSFPFLGRHGFILQWMLNNINTIDFCNFKKDVKRMGERRKEYKLFETINLETKRLGVKWSKCRYGKNQLMFMEMVIAYRKIFGSDTLCDWLIWVLGMSERGDTLDLFTSELSQQVLQLSPLWSWRSVSSEKVNQHSHFILVLKLFVAK